MALTEVIAVRHGESEGNVAREAAMAEQAELITIGQRDPDVPLSPRGRNQAEAVGRWLADYGAQPLAAIWSSPYVRARQTAEISIALAQVPLRIRIDERLRDRELGVLDLLTGSGVAARFPEEAARRRWLGKMYYRPPGGESWSDVALRLRSFVADLERKPLEGAILVYCHDAVIMLLCYVLAELTVEQLLDMARAQNLGNGSVTRLVRTGPETWEVAAFNEQRHLVEAGAPRTQHEGEADDAHR